MRFILGVFVGSIALFFWGYAFWGLSPYPSTVLEPMPNRDFIAMTLRDNIPKDGAYVIPEIGDPNDEDWAKRNESGPHITVLYHAGGVVMSNVMIKGYLHMLASTFVLALILATAGRRTYFGRFMLVFWIGLFVAIWAEMGDVVWWSYPLRYACLNQTYHVTSMILLGAILAYFVRPPADPSQD